MNKYVEIKNDIINKIISGELQSNSLIMSRHAMMDHYNVSITTVCKAIDELKNEGYIYTQHGKGAFVTSKHTANKDLINKRKLIAVIIPDMSIGNDSIIDIQTSNIAPILVHNLSVKSPEYNSDIVLYISNSNSNTEISNIRNAIQRKVDGIIIYPILAWKTSTIINEINASNIPYVVLDNNIIGSVGGFITTDHFNGAYNATNYLIDNFTDNIYHITVTEGPYSLSLRKYGYLDAMQNHNLPHKFIFADYPSSVGDLFNDFYNTIVKNIDLFKTKCAITTTNAYMMYGILSALVDNNINLENIALSYFDKISTTIDDNVLYINILQDLEGIANTALEMLVNKINKTGELSTKIISPVIYVKDNSVSKDYISIKDYI